jgi:hypothetical protein
MFISLKEKQKAADKCRIKRTTCARFVITSAFILVILVTPVDLPVKDWESILTLHGGHNRDDLTAGHNLSKALYPIRR